MSYTIVHGARGGTASNVQAVLPHSKVTVEKCVGLVRVEEGASKESSGLIELLNESSLPKSALSSILLPPGAAAAALTIPFANESNHHGSTRSLKHYREDEVTFTLNYIPGTTYCRATQVRLHRTKKERLQQEQIKAMVAAGIQAEQGKILLGVCIVLICIPIYIL